MVRKGPTQADVARAAGVSQTTVSMVLNDSYPAGVHLSEETRERVRLALQETGYVANPIARSLAGHRTNIIGVFGFEPVFTSGDSFYLPFMEGVEIAAERAGVDVLLFTSASGEAEGHHIYRQNENRLRLVDACVLVGNREPKLEVARLLEEGYPFVSIGRRNLGDGAVVPSVTPNYARATHQFIERLVGLGHERILYLAAGHDLPSGHDRRAGFEQASAQFGLASRILYGDDQPSWLDAAVASVLDNDVTAIVAEPLAHTSELLDALARAGLIPPADLSVGILGDPIATPERFGPWSGYRLPRVQMGIAAVEILLAALDGTPVPQQVEVDVEFVEGATVGPRRPVAS